jgi:hydrogenase-4 component E
MGRGTSRSRPESLDLLIIVACLGILVGYLLIHVGTTSSLDLNRLIG